MELVQKAPPWRRQQQSQVQPVLANLIVSWGIQAPIAIEAYKRASERWYANRTQKQESQTSFSAYLHESAAVLSLRPFEKELRSETSCLEKKWAAAALNCAYDSIYEQTRSEGFSPPDDWLAWSRSFVRKEVLGILLVGMRENCEQRLARSKIRDVDDVISEAIFRIASRPDLWNRFLSAKKMVGFFVEVVKRCSFEAVRKQIDPKLRRVIALRDLTFAIRSARENSPLSMLDLKKFLSQKSGYGQAYNHWKSSLSPEGRRLAKKIIEEGKCPATIEGNDDEYQQMQETMLNWLVSLETELVFRSSVQNLELVPDKSELAPNLDEPNYQIERLAIHNAYAAIEPQEDQSPLRQTLLLLSKWSDEPKKKQKRGPENPEDEGLRPLKQIQVAKLPLHDGKPPGNVRVGNWKAQSAELFKKHLRHSLRILSAGKSLISEYSPDVLRRTVRLSLTDRLVFCNQAEDGEGLRHRQAAILFWWTFGGFPYFDLGKELEMDCFFPSKDARTDAQVRNGQRKIKKFSEDAAKQWATLMKHYFDGLPKSGLPSIVREEIECLRQQIPPLATSDKDSMRSMIGEYLEQGTSRERLEGWL